ncbi:hypothetical protein SBD_0960 [Streptomyces bottropensis ATCC 25435]|uniref:Uncharacterized protein n=1 Tax=Streptomyces bottropensis ATCC 25435 TaxID=1054862 RepID=M3F9B5_9ACTN|nr:hypothetical protein SBD_0960 [Streptomyces bottropensis ATCC 25435]
MAGRSPGGFMVGMHGLLREVRRRMGARGAEGRVRCGTDLRSLAHCYLYSQ